MSAKSVFVPCTGSHCIMRPGARVHDKSKCFTLKGLLPEGCTVGLASNKDHDVYPEKKFFKNNHYITGQWIISVPFGWSVHLYHCRGSNRYERGRYIIQIQHHEGTVYWFPENNLALAYNAEMRKVQQRDANHTARLQKKEEDQRC